MHILPPAMILLLRPFAPLFSKRVWSHVQVLLAGAILTPAQRTVTAALRVVGLGHSPHFQRYHRVLNRAAWSALAASRVLLRLLVAAFVPDGPLVVGVDETLERRTGAQIAAKGVYRDAVRSSHSHFVKATGLRWVTLMLLAPIPWANRIWAFPFLTALAPSERYDVRQGRRHKALTDWAWQLLLVVRRWWPDRAIVAVADSGYAAIAFLARCQALRQPITMITRLRLDAALYTPAPPRQPHQNGRPRKKGTRLPTSRYAGGGRDHEMDVPHGDAVVRATGAHRRNRLGDRSVVSHRIAAGADPLGADPRPGGKVRDPSAALHRSERPAGADHCLVRATLADGNDLCGSAATPRRRDATAMDRVGDSPDDTGVARPLLARDPARASAPEGGIRPDPTGSMVSQARPDLRRRISAGQAGDLAEQGFLHVRCRGGHDKTPARVP